MTLLKELITIPEQVHQGDFVLKLAEGVQRPAETLRDYVITPQIRDAFDQALGLIKSAIQNRESKAAFLHGSFGSGKSHFMAVLHLLLAHEPAARGHHDLAPVVGKHDWLQDQKFLLVPFHMIGKKSLEQAVFDQYLATVKKHHPEAPVPAVFRGELVFEQAMVLRERMGDERFFESLGTTGGGLRRAVAWDAARFETARTAPPSDPSRQQLIGAVVQNLLPNYGSVVSADGTEGYVSIDEGLSILSNHAKELGYDSILLFLDEVILWLASMASDEAFVSREGTKLSKLIEFENARAIPIVSLLARQRDLRELVGEHMPGSERRRFLDAMQWWEGRFSTIKLEDRNLPVIVEKRLLQPKNDAARLQLDAAFDETRRLRQEIQETLRTSNYDEQDFRRVYPFSPALIQALVAVSAVLQRERTAIKVLMQLLVDQRDTLELGRIVPVGDLFDAIATGDEPFDEGLRLIFASCRRLYREKLRPRLCSDQGLSWDALQVLPPDDPKVLAFKADDRLIKTLMLAALVPEVEALKALTPRRLAALNHGTIRSPIPSQEPAIVLNKLRNWGADIGELQFSGDANNPTIALRIHGIDTEAILRRVEHEDNPGNRKKKVREILFKRLGLEWEDTLEQVHEHWWRGTKRRLTVVYGNVREMPAASLRSRGEDWKLVIDFPFDDEGHEPREDLDKVDAFRQSEGSTRTVCWLPAFLSPDRQKDLGRIYLIDYVLANETRFHDLASHLPPAERAQARSALQSQRDQLQTRIENALEAAYGLGAENESMLGATLPVEDRFQCLDASASRLRRPSATLGTALADLCDQMLQLQYPKHPEFDTELKGSALKKVYEWVKKAAHAELHRVVVDKADRKLLRAIVDPLGLGAMHEDALVLDATWSDHFLRCAAQEGTETLTVGEMRQWTDRPEPRGLPADVQDLLILTHAELNNLRFYLHGGAVQVSMDRRLDDSLELKPQELPPKEDFEAARERAQIGFGTYVGEVYGAANVGLLVDGVAEEVQKGLAPAKDLLLELGEAYRRVGLDLADEPRGKMAQFVVVLLEALQTDDAQTLTRRLADAEPPGTWEAFGASLKQAEAVVQALQNTRWQTMETAFALTDTHPEAAELREQLVAILRADELTASLPSKIRLLQTQAEQLVDQALRAREPTPTPGPQPAPQPAPPAEPSTPTQLIDQGEARHLDAEAWSRLHESLRDKLTTSQARLSVTWRLERPQE